jgi:hypothetical protein
MRAQPPLSFFQQAASETAPVMVRPNTDGVDFPCGRAMLAQGDEADRCGCIDGDKHWQFRCRR